MTELLRVMHDRKDFLDELWDGDDWAFVIKAQALVESAVSHALLAHIGDGRLRRLIEALPLVGDELSKLALAKDLGVLNLAQRRFVKKMASIRNRLAHKPDHASFTFEKFIVSLDRDAKRDWQESIPWFADDPEAKVSWAALSLRIPKSAVHVATFALVTFLATDGSEKEIGRNVDKLAMSTTKELLQAGGGE